MTVFSVLRAKAYAYLKEDGRKDKKVKGTKKCVVKREITFKNYKESLFNDKIVVNPNKDLEAIIIVLIWKKLIKQR